MATEKKYVSLSKLGLYDEKIKKVITDSDAATLAEAKSFASGLATNYDAAGSAASALVEAKAHADGKDSAIAEAKKAGTDAASAAAIADGKAVAAQTDVDNLETYVGTIPEGATATDVVGYVIEKTTGIASQGAMTELGNRVGVVEGEVAAIKEDYLKKSDKDELAGDIADVQTAVDTEKSRAEGIEAGLRTDINTVMGDYLKASDKTELQGNINTVNAAVERLTNGVSADEIDGVNDLIQYVKDHGTEVTGMQEDIADNAEAISGVAGRMDTAEGKITAVEGAVATKAEKTYVDDAVESLQGEDTAIKGRLDNLEAAIGESGSVAEDIEVAKQEAIDTAAEDATAKANTAETNAKNHANSLNTTMNTRVEALEAIDHEHSNKALLDTYTQTDANLADAVAKKHEHSNLSILEGITSAKVTAWDAAEGNAKTYADGLNSTLEAKVTANTEAINSFVECSEEDIANLFN